MLKLKSSKYRAQPTIVDGIRFASKLEASRYQELQLLLKAKKISALLRQVKFPLRSRHDPVVGHYLADFVYFNEDGLRVVEDCKGFDTPLGKWKIKHFELEYGIAVQLIRRARRRTTRRAWQKTK